jgi:hypothetical protein
MQDMMTMKVTAQKQRRKYLLAVHMMTTALKTLWS